MMDKIYKFMRTPIWLERLAIIALSIPYLMVFNRTVPHGDALRVVRQIQENHLIWNPNHLIFDPLGYVWYQLLSKFGFGISALDSFEIISGVSTVVSLLIFHALLVHTGVKSWKTRAIAVGGLFASRSFLSMAISQYYFMVQMPFLLLTLYLALRFLTKRKLGEDCSVCLYGMGVFAAVAAALMFNNVFLVMALGLAVGFTQGEKAPWNYGYAVRVWGAAAAVGLPIFVFGYMVSNTPDTFFSWLLSYQGESTSSLNELYGIQWSLRGVAESLARLGFNLFSASIIENAGLGTVVKVVLFREPLEFIPEITKLSLAIALTPLIVGTLLVLLIWMIRRFRRDPIVQLALAWIGAYLVFNFLWDVGGDMFWFQIVPVVWFLLIIYLGAARGPLFDESTANREPRQWKSWTLAFMVVALLAVNTLQTVVPVSLDLEARAVDHRTLLRDGDLEVVAGWDGLGWMQSDDLGPRVERIALMNMALLPDTAAQNIRMLPQIVARQLALGQRVVVARLYDKDHGINPWYGLARLGWPRSRIQTLLSGYCNKELGKVDDVIFREIYTCRPGHQPILPDKVS